MHHRSVVFLTRFFAAALAAGAVARAGAAPFQTGANESPAIEKTAATLPEVLERVHVAASTEEWRKEGWTDPLIEGWIREAITAVREAGHGKELPEPVAFASYAGRDPLVRPNADPFAAPRPGEGALVVTRRLKVGRLRQTVALVDGDADVSFAHHCVIIARGAVRIAHGAGNIVVAGRFLHVSHDGSQRSSIIRQRLIEAMAAERGRPLPQRPERQRPIPPVSLLVSGGVLDVSHAGGTVCAGLARVDISHALGCVFVNSPNVEAGRRTECVDLKLENVRLGDPPKPHPLAADLRLHSLAGDGMVIFYYKDRRYVAEKDKPIANEAGEPVPELAGWMLAGAEGGRAVFDSDQERAIIVLERQNGR